MKTGLRVGMQAVVTDVVTRTMRPMFEGEVVHPVYGTVAMVYHMEWAARKAVLPFLDDDEEGIGTGVQVRHLHAAPVGATIRAEATCTRLDGNVVLCDVQVWQDNQLLGEGQVEQRIYSRHALHERFSEFWARDLVEDSK